MRKYKKTGVKSERISVRCTKAEKQKLEGRALLNNTTVAEYVMDTLFPRKRTIEAEHITILVELQDVVTTICEKYKDDSIQEEMDDIWEKIRKL